MCTRLYRVPPLASTPHARVLLVCLLLCLLLCPGYVQAQQSQQCTPCPENTICFEERNTSCPAHSAAPAGTGSVDACVCHVGFHRETKDYAIACQPCQPGTYCMNQMIHDCPPNSTSTDQAVRLTDCYCRSGYTGNNGADCQACPAGTYKTDSGAAACTPCAQNTYSDSTARTTACDSCPEGHVSVSGSSQPAACVSAPGWYTGQAWHWADKRLGVWKCPHGTYQPERGQSACLQCVLDTPVSPATWTFEFSIGQWMPAYTPLMSVSSSACVQCGTNSFLSKVKSTTDGVYPTRSFSTGLCHCEPGYEDLDGSTLIVTCRSCRPGKYKTLLPGAHLNLHNTLDCVPCPADSYSATPPTKCTLCPPTSSAPGGSADITSCACLAGHGGSPGAVACAPCAAGLVPDGPSANRTCRACPTDTYASNVSAATSCTACTSDASSPAASYSIASCKCNAGFQMSYQMTIGICLPCLPGQFNPTSNSVCQVCGPNTFSSGNSQTLCTACPENSAFPWTAATSLRNCSCNAGYASLLTGDLQHCVPCAAGKFKAAGYTPGFAECAQCAEDTVSDTAAAQCVPCAAHSSTGGQGQTVCLCDPGYEFVDEVCRQCAAGHFKTTRSNGVCESCPAGSISKPGRTGCETCTANTYQQGADECTPCPANSVSEVASTSPAHCLCDAGYANVLVSASEPQCAKCYVGTYKETAANSLCLSCTTGYTSAEEGGVSASDCTACQFDFFGISTDIAIENQITRTRRECIACPANSQSAEAAAFKQSCLCNAGYTGTSLTSCTACEPGKYKSGTGSDACSLCADGKTLAVPGASSVTQCALCPAATFSTSLVTGATACMSCTSNAFSVAGSTTDTDCLCNAGYESTQDESTPACTACAAGTFKASRSPAQEPQQLCQACPDDTYSDLTGSTACLACAPNAQHNLLRQACECKPGYECTASTATTSGRAGCSCVPCQPGTFRALGEPQCAPCPANTFYPEEAGPFVLNRCQSCPANSQSAAGTYGSASCVCDAGYHREGDACRDCLTDHFCPDGVREQPCMLNSISPAGSDSALACQCIPGLVGDMHSGIPCTLCPVNTYCAGGRDSTPCPLFSTTHGETGKVLRASCDCGRGFYNESFSGLCVECPPQTFCANEAKYRCPPNASSAKGSTVCICDAEFRTHNATSTPLQLRCEACPADAVCRGGNDWEQCSAGALNRHGRCVCAAGSACSSQDSQDVASCHPPSACAACPANHYCADNARLACPPLSSAPANSSLRSQCICDAGHYRVDDTCHPCLAGSYCISQTQFACTALDPDLVGQRDLAVSSDDCICVLGYFRVSMSDKCQPCPQDFYCPSEATEGVLNVYACFENAHTNGPGKSKVESCVCGAGLKFSSEAGLSACLPCDVGSRCSSGIVESVSCSYFNREPNADHSACVCLPGFYATTDQGICQACAEGQSKRTAGDEACEECPANTWSLNTTTCAACPPRSSATPGSGSCACTLGFKQSGLRDSIRCEPCGPDTYFTGEAGLSGYCQPCPPRSITPVGAVALEACVCEPGYVRGASAFSAIFCVPCPPATYEAAGVCVPCGGHRSAPAASRSEAACACNATLCQRTWHKTCLGACEDLERLSAPAPCTACRAGTFKPQPSTPGNREPCAHCPPNTYQPQPQSTACLACHRTRGHLTTGQADVERCVCNAGHEPGDRAPETVATRHNNTACQPCENGFYKLERGNYLCQACAKDSFATALGSTGCISCRQANPLSDAVYSEHDASTTASDCTCNAGFTPELGHVPLHCVSCARGSFKSSVGTEPCAMCGQGAHANQYGDDQSNDGLAATNALHCVACPQNAGQNTLAVTRASPMTIMDAISKCVCFPGHHRWTPERCESCPPYQYKVGFSNDACQLCANNSYFTSMATHCRPCVLAVATCGAHSYWRGQDAPCACSKARTHSVAVNLVDPAARWGTSRADCECEQGHERLGETCEECLPGHYRGPEELSERHCSKCPPAHYQPLTGSPRCVPCPPFSSHVNGSQATGRATCLCDAGYFWREPPVSGGFSGGSSGDSAAACVPCDAGTFKAQPARTLPEPATAEANTAPCQTCPAHTYSRPTATECTPCGANMFADAGASAPELCFCNAGFGGPDCESCPSDTFWAGARVQRQACTACPLNKSSPPGSTASSACRCVPGHGVAADAQQDAPCAPCASGSFSRGGANAPCESCGWGAVTEAAATGPESCMCNASAGLRVV